MMYPLDIQRDMKDCILAVMWPKKHIIEFFKHHGCTDTDLQSATACIDQVSRRDIVDIGFQSINQRSDSGLGIFRSMMAELVKWSHFDPYYFGTLKKLDRADAAAKIQRLRSLQEERDADVITERQRKANHIQEVTMREQRLSDIRTEFLALQAGKKTPQERGYAFERILRELAQLNELAVTDAFRVNGEQIDGAIKYDGEHYIIEANWQEKSANNDTLSPRMWHPSEEWSRRVSDGGCAVCDCLGGG